MPSPVFPVVGKKKKIGGYVVRVVEVDVVYYFSRTEIPPQFILHHKPMFEYVTARIRAGVVGNPAFYIPTPDYSPALPFRMITPTISFS